ncbi:MAG: thioredoxin domain-containing protein [Myxococcales bacterium]|nr:thioredoxin domain-containing protein [Myxococcales bacterium]
MRTNNWALGRALALGLLCVSLGGCNRPAQDEHEHTASAAAEFDGAHRHLVALAGDDHALGGDEPLVTIVVFSGYACPPCGRTWQVLDNLVEDYGDSVRVVFRALTMPGFSTGEQAIEAALAAGAQGRFWPMHRRLYEAGGQLDRAKLESLAQALELDMTRFRDDLDTGVHTGTRMRHRRQALELGIEFGPIAFVNGRPVVGFRSEPEWHALIDQELGEARGRLDGGVARSALYDDFMAEAVKERVELPEELLARYRELLAARAPEQDVPAQRPDPELRYAVGAEGAPTIGPEDAPVLIVAFMDLECPYCKRLHAEALGGALRERFPADVRVAIRHYPLPIHPAAGGIARACVAAQRQGKFWPFYERLMAAKGGSLSRTTFLELVHELELDKERFLADLDDPEVLEVVREDLLLGRRLGVDGTPGLFINGRYLSGYQPLDALAQRVEEELELARASETPRADYVDALLERAVQPSQFPNAAL